jgi:hypothetical protein
MMTASQAPVDSDDTLHLQDLSFFPLSQATEMIRKVGATRNPPGLFAWARTNVNVIPFKISLVMSRGIDGGALTSINRQDRPFRSIAQVSRNMHIRVNIYKRASDAKDNQINVSHKLWSTILTDGSRHILYLYVDEAAESAKLYVALVRASADNISYMTDDTFLVYANDVAIFDFIPIGLMVGFAKDHIILESSPSIAYS